jgi:hypothetical protein
MSPRAQRDVVDLYRTHGGRIHARCLFLLGDERQAMDALSAVFAASSSLGQDCSPLAALTRSTTLHCLSNLRDGHGDWHEPLRRALAVVRLDGDDIAVLLEERAVLRWSLVGCAETDVELAALASWVFVDDIAVEDVATQTGMGLPALRDRLRAFLSWFATAVAVHRAGDPTRAVAVMLPSTEPPPSLLARIEVSAERRTVSLFDIERFVCGELVGADADHVRSALAADPTLAAICDELVAADRAFLAMHPPAALAAAIRDRRAHQARGWARVVGIVRARISGPLVAAATAATVALFVAVQASDGADAGADAHRTPGAVRDRGAEHADTQNALAAGHPSLVVVVADPVGRQRQFVVRDPVEHERPPGAIVVVGVDGAGRVSTYVAEPVEAAQAGTTRSLSPRLPVTELRRPERFFAVWGDDVLETRDRTLVAAETVARSVRSGSSLAAIEMLPLPATVAQASVWIDGSE